MLFLKFLFIYIAYIYIVTYSAKCLLNIYIYLCRNLISYIPLIDVGICCLSLFWEKREQTSVHP